MKNQQDQLIQPRLGGYFKHDNKIYKAMRPEINAQCDGCCFWVQKEECHAPTSLCCAGLIFHDVTDTVTDELIDEAPSRHGYYPVISIMITWAIVIGWVIYKVFTN